MRSYTAALMLMIFCISCGEPEKHGKPRAYSIPNTKTNRFVLILNNANIISGPAVGFAGERTPEYESYEWLLKNGSDSLLIELIENPNPYTKTYAFMALCERKNETAASIFDQYKNDTTPISKMDGCIFERIPLNYLWSSEMGRLPIRVKTDQ